MRALREVPPLAKRVLSVSYEPQLLRSRELILRQAGYEVISATSLAEVMEACARSNFDFAVIGHSISRQQQEEIAETVREHCDPACIVGLQLLATDRLPFADVTVRSHDPAALVALLRRSKPLSGRRRNTS